MTVRRKRFVLAAAALVVACAGAAFAQPAPIPIRHVAMTLDTGVVAAAAGQAEPGTPVQVYSKWISVPNSEWLRLKFDQVVLAGDPQAGTGSFLRITSAQDGAFQTMDSRHVVDWSNSSAVFNGDTVLLEVYAYPGTGANRLSMSTIMSSEPGGMGPESICGNTDDRALSNDARQGRLWPVGCTAWMIDNGNCANRFLTAGHCIAAGSAGNIVQFNVPLSTAAGGAVAPPPQDQFPVLAASIQSTGDAGIGVDAAQFFTGVNSTTSLHARVHMGGNAYTLASSAPAVGGATIRVTGYGTVSSPVSPTWNLVQKTHTGPNVAPVGNNIRYTVDTTGGNSGSPVVTEANGLAIGIHTHAGCTAAAGTFNNGTAIQFATLQGYLNNPLGPCAPMAGPVDPVGGPFAEGGVADHFNRANGPIGSDWIAAGAANLANFTVSGNAGAHAAAGGVEFIQNEAYQGDYKSGVVWVNAIMNGTASQFVAVATGMGGSGNFIYAKVQAQTNNGNYSHVAFYTSAGGPWAGGLPFTALGANEFSEGRIRLSISPDGDTASLDVDTDFDGVPEFTYSSSGVNAIASGFGNKFGLGAWQGATYDNWNATNIGSTDNFNRANGPLGSPWVAAGGTFANFSISGNAGAHTAAVLGDVIRYSGVNGAPATRSQWVDIRVNGTALQYVGLAAGLGGSNYIFVKAQAQTSTGNISNLGFYQGSTGGAWPGMTGGTGFFAVTSEFPAARVRLTISPDGDMATYDIDTDFDGVPDQSYARGGINGIAGLGNGFGLTAYGPAVYDNYAILGNAGDAFNRANGPIGGTWAANAGPMGNFSISGSAGTYTGGSSSGIIQNNGFKAAVMDHRHWLDVSLQPGAGTAFVALCGGLGGTNNYFVKVQQNGAGLNFNTAGFYVGNNNSVWGITGGAAFFTLTTPFAAGRIRVTVGPDGDTITLDIDSNFDGIADESHSRGGLASLKAGMGNRYGIAAFGGVNFDNWAASPAVPEASCYPDCNQSGNLTIADFACFQAAFAGGQPYADCNNSGTLTIADFACFQAAFAGGCP